MSIVGLKPVRQLTSTWVATELSGRRRWCDCRGWVGGHGSCIINNNLICTGNLIYYLFALFIKLHW